MYMHRQGILFPCETAIHTCIQSDYVRNFSTSAYVSACTCPHTYKSMCMCTYDRIHIRIYVYTAKIPIHGVKWEKNIRNFPAPIRTCRSQFSDFHVVHVSHQFYFATLHMSHPSFSPVHRTCQSRFGQWVRKSFYKTIREGAFAQGRKEPWHLTDGRDTHAMTVADLYFMLWELLRSVAAGAFKIRTKDVSRR
jgi:hypothetical protein